MRIKKCYTKNGKPYYSAPLVVNIQLSSYCPFKCSFCFMPQIEKIDMSVSALHSILSDLAEIGCRTILFGQGEPMVCSNILKAVELARSFGFSVKIATSGAGCTYNKLRRLYELGLNELCISINCFNESINNRTRMGFEEAINSIQLSKSIGMRTRLNYVAQNDTIDMFPEYIQYAEKYEVDGISILREKADRTGEIGKYSRDKLKKLASYIKTCSIPIDIEECFCELNVFLSSRQKASIQGCAAGKAMMAVGADGSFYPCSHLSSKAEKFTSVIQYWEGSEILAKLRDLYLEGEPCCNCVNVSKCTTCQAIYKDKRDSFHKSRVECPVYSSE